MKLETLKKEKYEELETDILIIGGGTAGLSYAYYLNKFINQKNIKNKSDYQQIPQTLNPTILILEKGKDIGSHSFSGAVISSECLEDFFQEFGKEQVPLEAKVIKESFYYLSPKKAYKFPFIPPDLQNKNNHIFSVSKFNKWLSDKLSNYENIDIFPEFSAVEPVFENGKMAGILTEHKGLNKEGIPQENFQPGIFIKSKLNIFAEGSRGSLFQKTIKELDLPSNVNPEVFELGVKEIIKIPENKFPAGTVIHTTGFPLNQKKTVGGSFIYFPSTNHIIIGLAAFLDTPDPLFDLQNDLQKFKKHPFIQNLIKNGKVVSYGAKTIPAGGWYSIPQLFGDGWMVCGDSAHLVNTAKLKGIHLTIESAKLAAQASIDALLKNEFSQKQLKNYQEKVNNSKIKSELFKVRNFHQALSKKLPFALFLLLFQKLTKGRGIIDPMKILPDYKTTKKLNSFYSKENQKNKENKEKDNNKKYVNELNYEISYDNNLYLDKLTDVYLSGTNHREDSPNHLIIKDSSICQKCKVDFNSPCSIFCPANVYNMEEQETNYKNYKLTINYTNCIHCKACNIKCPFDNIIWTPPEGGGGPQYQET